MHKKIVTFFCPGKKQPFANRWFPSNKSKMQPLKSHYTAYSVIMWRSCRGFRWEVIWGLLCHQYSGWVASAAALRLSLGWSHSDLGQRCDQRKATQIPLNIITSSLQTPGLLVRFLVPPDSWPHVPGQDAEPWTLGVSKGAVYPQDFAQREK